MKERTEEKLLRKQFEKFQRCEHIPDFLRKGCYDSKYLSILRRRSFHRAESSSKKSNNAINTLPCLLHHKHTTDKTLIHNNNGVSHVCKTKSNSMPRSFVERRKGRKRAKVCNNFESTISKYRFDLPNTYKGHTTVERPQAVSQPKTEPVSTISEVFGSNFVFRGNKENLVYL